MPDIYGNLAKTARDLFDYSLGEYDEKEMGNHQISHSVLYMIHAVITHVFLINYLVAILSNVY